MKILSTVTPEGYDPDNWYKWAIEMKVGSRIPPIISEIKPRPRTTHLTNEQDGTDDHK